MRQESGGELQIARERNFNKTHRLWFCNNASLSYLDMDYGFYKIWVFFVDVRFFKISSSKIFVYVVYGKVMNHSNPFPHCSTTLPILIVLLLSLSCKCKTTGKNYVKYSLSLVCFYTMLPWRLIRRGAGCRCHLTPRSDLKRFEQGCRVTHILWNTFRPSLFLQWSICQSLSRS